MKLKRESKPALARVVATGVIGGHPFVAKPIGAKELIGVIEKNIR